MSDPGNIDGVQPGAQRSSTANLDARSLRALAHPLRVRLLDLLRADGPATASGLAQRVGESSGTTSWHLRQLAEHGLVEEDATRGTKRERWWKPTHESHSMRVADFVDDPELAGPLNVYLQSLIQQRFAVESQFVAELPQWLDRWKDKASFYDDRLFLSPAEALALTEEVQAVVERYRRIRRDGDDTVVTHWAAFPRATRPEES
ncbi:Helix-turn-helix domain-containing protein [Amycolatopsis marina]|uniref:Helix-turn-helix domain-containing protein n=1 Tax=Amycolatopsis marina TaxID=490629 RepID=A0A1I1C216_9PSEU|nr:winged helix-turn-helix domain-containing protein [Amycolatopsis marina]SFB54948.1 Helix-turn-helix domain-containing protein [Amycolatopsis marina]